jgi:hypothetical protein
MRAEGATGRFRLSGPVLPVPSWLLARRQDEIVSAWRHYRNRPPATALAISSIGSEDRSTGRGRSLSHRGPARAGDEIPTLMYRTTRSRVRLRRLFRNRDQFVAIACRLVPFVFAFDALADLDVDL